MAVCVVDPSGRAEALCFPLLSVRTIRFTTKTTTPYDLQVNPHAHSGVRAAAPGELDCSRASWARLANRLPPRAPLIGSRTPLFQRPDHRVAQVGRLFTVSPPSRARDGARLGLARCARRVASARHAPRPPADRPALARDGAVREPVTPICDSQGGRGRCVRRQVRSVERGTRDRPANYPLAVRVQARREWCCCLRIG